MRSLEITTPQDIILVFSLNQLHKIRKNIDNFNKNYVNDKKDKGRVGDFPHMVNYVCC